MHRVILAFLISLALPLHAAQRVALVVGCGKYDQLPPGAQLAAAVPDANSIADALAGIQPVWTVIRLNDAKRDDCIAALDRFATAAKGAECAIIYVGSHGLEYHGENFFLTRDSDLAREAATVQLTKERFASRSLSLSLLKDTIGSTGAALSLIILDACRENPVPPPPGARRAVGGERGLAPAGGTPAGLLIAYAAQEGQLANDGLFTPTLVKHIKTPGLNVSRLLARTRDEVIRTSREWADSDERSGLSAGRRRVFQQTAEYGSLNEAALDFAFIPGNAARMPDTPDPLRPKTAAERIRDGAVFFSDSAKTDASRAIGEVERTLKKDIVIETFRDIPKAVRSDTDLADTTAMNRLFEEWAKKQARQQSVNGVYILILKQPAHLQVVVGDQTIKQIFTPIDRDALVRTMLTKLHAFDNDGALRESVNFIASTMRAHVAEAAVHSETLPPPAK